MIRLVDAAEAWGKVHEGMQRFGMESAAIDTVADFFALSAKSPTEAATSMTDEQSALKPCSLNECPPGLFYFGETLGFKSEYKTKNESTGRYQCDAYVVESGEYFWGGVSNVEARSNLMVRPVAAMPDARDVDDDDNPCPNGAHCCCCGPGKSCCDCGEIIPPDAREVVAQDIPYVERLAYEQRILAAEMEVIRSSNEAREVVAGLVEALEVASGDLHMLKRAVEEGDPKRELITRAKDCKRDLGATLTTALALLAAILKGLPHAE